MELCEYTTQELYNELRMRSGVYPILWVPADFKQALEEEGMHDPSEDEVIYFSNIVGDDLMDSCISRGWDVLYDAAHRYANENPEDKELREWRGIYLEVEQSAVGPLFEG